MTKHCILKIHGAVHGVGFRASAKQKADELDITGFVRNEPDGTVYIEAQGPSEALDKFVAWCERGPSYARITQVKCEWREQTKNFNQFTIAR